MNKRLRATLKNFPLSVFRLRQAKNAIIQLFERIQENNIINSEPSNQPTDIVRFRWSYVILPLAMLCIAVIITAIFSGRLPAETAYRFSDGEPINWTGRGSVIGWSIGLQLVFVLLSLGMTYFIVSTARRLQMVSTQANHTLFTIIGNILALPQIIIVYALIDIFLYNIYGKGLPSLWIFAVAVMLLGGIVLITLFVRAAAQSKKLKMKIISGSKSDVS